MKGVLFLHLRSFLEKTYPGVGWDNVLGECGIAHMFLSGWDYPDDMMNCIASEICRLERISGEDFWQRFGKHSMNEFRKNYHWYFDEHPDARSFLLSVDAIHADALKNVARAHPPRFSSRMSEDRREVAITYTSERGMVDYLRGALEGILAIYGESGTVEIEGRADGGARLRVRFT